MNINDIKYSQILVIDFLGEKILTKFMVYRPDLKRVIYDHNNCLFQTEIKNIKLATDKDIIDIYENKINILKKDIKNLKKEFKMYKNYSRNALNNLINMNKEIKETKTTIFKYNHINVILNNDICKESMDEIRKLTKLKGRSRNCYYSMMSYNETKNRIIRNINNVKKYIGDYKKERKDWLENEIYIK